MINIEKEGNLEGTVVTLSTTLESKADDFARDLKGMNTNH